MKQSQLTAKTVHTILTKLAKPERAKTFTWFFKTGPGEYGEGDRFMGITVPELRRTVREYRTLPLKEVMYLLHSALHEERLLALFVLIHQFSRGDETTQKTIYDLYLANTNYINNWDLVDASAYQIVGSWLSRQSAKTTKTTLTKLAHSKLLWERRIAMIATFHWIRRGDSAHTLTIAKLLLPDRHDLIQKAVGWMLREVGKRCSESTLKTFLDKHIKMMGRTSVHYAIEKFPEPLRKNYLHR